MMYECMRFGVLFDEENLGGKWYEGEDAVGAQAKLARIYARASNDYERTSDGKSSSYGCRGGLPLPPPTF